MNKTLNLLLAGLTTSLLIGFFAVDFAAATTVCQASGFSADSGDGFDDFGANQDTARKKKQSSSGRSAAAPRGGKFSGGGGMGMGGMGAGGPGGGMGAGGPGGSLGGSSAGGMGQQGDEEDYGGAGDMGEMFGGGGMGMDMGGQGMHAPNRVKLILQMYPIGDLIKKSNNNPFNGFALPGLGNQSFPTPQNRGGGRSGMGGGGLGGGASGGGVFAIPSSSFQGMGGGMGGMEGGYGGGGGPSYPSYSFSSDISIDELNDAIISTVAAESWRQNGGVGTTAFLRDLMIVNQTEAVHKQVNTFLQMLRAATKSKPTVTIKAVWLTIDEDLFQSLDVEADQQVNSKVLAQLVKTHGRRAQVTCFDGEIVHVAAGNLKSSIESVVPVVGQNDIDTKMETRFASLIRKKNRKPVPTFVMAQSLGDEDESAFQDVEVEQSPSNVGYQPIARWINYGAVLQVQPKVDADQKMLTLTVSSVLVSGPDAAGTAKGKSEIGNQLRFGGVNLTDHNLKTQQFQSNLRLKNATPTLVGGAAFQSDSNIDQTYLIIEAIVNND